jgi:hypothetical protein
MTTGNNDTDTETKPSRFKVTDAFVIFCATAIAYILVFSYEVGYCEYFGISRLLIRPDLNTFLIHGGVGLALALLLGELAYIAFVTIYSALAASTKTILRLAFFWLFFIPIAYLMLKERALASSYIRIIIAFLILVPSVTFVGPLLCLLWQKPKHSYYWNLSVWVRPPRYLRFLQPFWREARERGQWFWLGALLILLAAVFAARGVGEYDARKESIFLYRDKPTNVVVLKVYGGTAITARIDTNGNVYPEFHYVKLEGEKDVFTVTNLGPLRVHVPR